MVGLVDVGDDGFLGGFGDCVNRRRLEGEPGEGSFGELRLLRGGGDLRLVSDRRLEVAPDADGGWGGENRREEDFGDVLLSVGGGLCLDTGAFRDGDLGDKDLLLVCNPGLVDRSEL